MSQTLDSKGAPADRDERTQRRSLGRRLLSRPEIGSAVGAIVIFAFFLVVAPTFRTLPAQFTVLYSASTIGIVAVGVALLMIGGEFDLSTGVGVISSALVASMFAFQMSANVWVGVVIALLFSLAIGFFNGWLVMTTGIPSFLVTLGTFLMLRGANIAVTKLVTGGVASPTISDIEGFGSARTIFASSFTVAGQTIRITVIYWLLLVALVTWVLLRTKIGNWIFAVGGNAPSARAVGVPVRRVKIGLFMFVGFCAWLLGMHQLFAFSTVQSGGGIGEEFIYIIAAVIGGTLLTGGYGSAVGAAIGAYIFGMARQSIVYAGWDANWYFFFLGLMLLLATVANNWVRQSATRDDAMSEHTTKGREDVMVPGEHKPLVEMRDVGKNYGHIYALQSVSLQVRSSEITCVLGDNGAGKSTLIKIVAGLHQHSEGDFLVDGESVTFNSPRDALDRGIATVYQDLAVVSLMPVWRNFFMGLERTRGPWPFRRLDVDMMRSTAREELLKMGIDLPDMEQPVGTLSGGQRQCVAIARAVYFGARILILDEPTAALGVKQSGVVLKYVAAARDSGLGVIFITHNPHHAFMVGDHFVILKLGQMVLDKTRDETDLDQLTTMMAGGDELATLSHELER